MPEIKIIGVHPFEYDDTLFDEAMTRRHGLIALNRNKDVRDRADFELRQELAGIVLVELVVFNRDRAMYMGDFGQSAGDLPGPDDPVAHGEVFLSPDGESRLADYLDQVDAPDVRVAFYLHGYRPDRPILTSYGPVDPPPLTMASLRLKRLVPYRFEG